MTDLAPEIICLLEQTDDIQSRVNDLKAAMALDCPHQPGDVIEVPRAAYVHIGKQMVVDKVFTVAQEKWRGGGYDFKYHIAGRVMKKDGSAGNQKVTFQISIEGA